MDNIDLTKKICDIIIKNKLRKILVFASSTQVLKNTYYGKSKKKCEISTRFKKKNNSKILIMRLPNIFGKWCKPNYNSVVSTFCYNIARNKKVKLFSSNSKIKLLYIR